MNPTTGPFSAALALLLVQGQVQRPATPTALQQGHGAAAAGPQDALGFRLRDTTAARGLTTALGMVPGMATGVAVADIDDDGDVDLFLPRPLGRADRLFLNDGQGHFTDEAASRGLGDLAEERVGLFLDVDADADLDLLTTNDDLFATSSFRLFTQDAHGGFGEVTASAGVELVSLVSVSTHRGGACAADWNGDGYLDVYSASWNGFPTLFLNDGDGTFTDATGSSQTAVFEHGWQPMAVDVTEDGIQDIYVAVDFAPNRLWINDGNASFTDAAPIAGCDVVMNDMGMSILDWDNDGDFDLYTTNIYDWPGAVPVETYNVLLRREPLVAGLPRYVDVSVAAGVDEGAWGWGVTGVDLDLDGLLEIAETNGWNAPAWIRRVPRIWKRPSVDVDRFSEVGRAAGFGTAVWGSSLVSCDVDRDGDADLVEVLMDGRLLLHENRLSPMLAATRHSLVVRPRSTGPNTHGIGAVVRVEVGELRLMRLVSAGASLLGQEPAEAFFGLGDASLAERVTVTFADGTLVELTNVAADQVLTVQHP